MCCFDLSLTVNLKSCPNLLLLNLIFDGFELPKVQAP